jgi:hypothetical protein
MVEDRSGMFGVLPPFDQGLRKGTYWPHERVVLREDDVKGDRPKRCHFSVVLAQKKPWMIAAILDRFHGLTNERQEATNEELRRKDERRPNTVKSVISTMLRPRTLFRLEHGIHRPR